MTREQAEQIARKHANADRMTYNEWYEKVGASLWRDAEISTADILRAAWVSATIAEREACAKVCESFGGNGSGYIDDDWAAMCAKTIRAR